MQLATWLSVAMLGIVAPAIFVWFLFDLRRILRENAEPAAQADEEGDT